MSKKINQILLSQTKKHCCDECDYSAKMVSAVRNHKKKKHVSVQQLYGNTTLKDEKEQHMNEKESSDTDSDMESEAEQDELSCFRELK